MKTKKTKNTNLENIWKESFLSPIENLVDKVEVVVEDVVEEVIEDIVGEQHEHHKHLPSS